MCNDLELLRKSQQRARANSCFIREGASSYTLFRSTSGRPILLSVVDNEAKLWRAVQRYCKSTHTAKPGKQYNRPPQRITP